MYMIIEEAAYNFVAIQLLKQHTCTSTYTIHSYTCIKLEITKTLIHEAIYNIVTL